MYSGSSILKRSQKFLLVVENTRVHSNITWKIRRWWPAPVCLLPSNTAGRCQPSGFTHHYYCLRGRESMRIGLGGLDTIIIRRRPAGSPASSSIGSVQHAATKLRIYRPRTVRDATRLHIISFGITNAAPRPSIIRWDDSVAIVFMQQSTENFPKMKNNPNQPQYGPRTVW